MRNDSLEPMVEEGELFAKGSINEEGQFLINTAKQEKKMRSGIFEALKRLKFRFTNSSWKSIDFSGVSLADTDLSSCEFLACDLRKVYLKHSNLSGVSFTNSNLLKIDIDTEQTMECETISALAVSPDQSFIALGSFDRNVKRFDFKTGEFIDILTVHPSYISAIAISDEFVASSDISSSVVLWDMRLRTVVHQVTIDVICEISSVFSRDLSSIAKMLWESPNICVWDVNTGELKNKLTGHSKPVFSISISSDAKYLLSSAKDKFFIQWNLETNTIVSQTKYDSLQHIAFSNDDSKYLLASTNGNIRVFDWNRLILHIEAKSDQIETATFSPDDEYIVWVTSSNAVIFYNLASRAAVFTTICSKLRILALGISPNSSYFATGGPKGKIKLWRVSNQVKRSPYTFLKE